jgi:hypothetical protein
MKIEPRVWCLLTSCTLTSVPAERQYIFSSINNDTSSKVLSVKILFSQLYNAAVTRLLLSSGKKTKTMKRSSDERLPACSAGGEPKL